MKVRFDQATTFWNTILLGSVIFTVFIAPCFPGQWELPLFKAGYTLIFISAIFSIEKHRRFMIIVAAISLIVEWVSLVFNLTAILGISKLVKIFFFSFIVFSLISHLVTSRTVTPRVILDSISGYLLLGLVYYIFISMIMNADPDAFHFPSEDPSLTDKSHLSEPLYFSLVTMSTTGYGDIVPVKPYVRSLATFISVCGQMYIAIIVAMLVGKFASRKT
jgi:voltage-gated potassium channel